MDLEQLLIYADTAPGVGAGHFVRCLALAEAATDAGFDVELLTDTIPAAFERSGREAGFAVTSDRSALERVTEQATAVSPAWVVLDSYRLTPAVLAPLTGFGGHLAVIADHGAPAVPADLILDQNAGADPRVYATTGAVVLAGARFALLRPAFRRARGVPPSSVPAGLVMAGGDPGPQAVELIAAVLRRLGDHPIELLGPGFDHVDLPPNARRLGFTADPVAAMAGRPWALTAAGSTVWELCCLGVPAVLLAIAANQEPVGRAVADAGVGDYLGPVSSVRVNDVADAVERLISDGKRRSEMSRAASSLVDGLGGARVAMELRAGTISLRDATLDDARMLFEWANDPDVRSASFSSDPIAWTEHLTWLEARLGNPNAWTFIARARDEPIGLIRFDRIDAERLRVGVALGKAARGRRLASPLIVTGTRAALARSGAASVVADVKVANLRSTSAFEAAGYELSDQEDGALRFEFAASTAPQPSTSAF